MMYKDLSEHLKIHIFQHKPAMFTSLSVKWVLSFSSSGFKNSTFTSADNKTYKLSIRWPTNKSFK